MKKSTESTPRLTRTNWINTAIEVFKIHGIEKVKIDSIAKDLRVTRGSFYWHFKKRQDLLDEILLSWEEINTRDVIKNLDNLKLPEKKQLEQLLKLAFSSSVEDFAFEKSIRVWALTDENVMNVLKRMDKQRISYLQRLIVEIGWTKKEAEQHACYIYFCRTGLYHQAQIPRLNKRMKIVDYMMEILVH